MSEFQVRVVQITNIAKLANSDNLSLTNIDDYPVIIRTGEFSIGDKAVYIPVDSVVPNEDKYAFLAGNFRIKAKRLRGTFSMGLLIKYPDNSWEIGQLVHKELGITKYIPRAEKIAGENNSYSNRFKKYPWYKKLYYTLAGLRPKTKIKGSNLIPEYTDLDSLRKYKNLFTDEDEVCITIKQHGTNARYCWFNNKFWVGSHHTFKNVESEPIGYAWWRLWRRIRGKGLKASTPAMNWWQEAAQRYDLENKLRDYPNYIFFGEVYGDKVQRNFPYDCEPNQVKFRVFDIYNIDLKEYLTWSNVVHFCKIIGLDTVIEVYTGFYDPEVVANLSNGPDPLNPKHTREGVVVKTLSNPRKILKLVGNDYLLLKHPEE